MCTARNIAYELSERVRAVDTGGIGALHVLAQRSGLVDAIDEHVQVLKAHLPYHESDHVLGIAYNVLCGRTCLQDIELRRRNEVYLDALGAQRIPDPTTAGNFWRRFDGPAIDALQTAINETRSGVWQQQPNAFSTRRPSTPIGTLVETTGRCKEGMDIAYNGTWSYHPLVVSLADTGELVYLVNRSGNRRSAEGAAERYDQSSGVWRRAGFRRVTLRGDTDFSQTAHVDRWHHDGVRFVCGYDARANLVACAEALPEAVGLPLTRRPTAPRRTVPRQRPANVKAAVIRARGFRQLTLGAEAVAAFPYQPTGCRETCRMVVLRKNISVEQGERLFDEIRYFFCLTNDRETPASAIVFLANERYNQENLVAQLQTGMGAMQLPVDTLLSKRGVLVMAALAWTLNAWFALQLPERGRWVARHRQEK